MMGPVEKMLSEAKSLEEFRDQLSKVNAKMSAAPFGRLMQSAMMLAELSGRFSVKKTT
jgi:phage gp29-like protein